MRRKGMDRNRCTTTRGQSLTDKNLADQEESLLEAKIDVMIEHLGKVSATMVAMNRLFELYNNKLERLADLIEVEQHDLN